KSARQVDAAIREADILALLIFNPVRRSGHGIAVSPAERDDPTACITIEIYLRFDLIRNRGAGASDESSILRGKKGADVPGFVKCDKIILPCKLAPHLNVDEVIWSPRVRANVFA